MFKFFERLTTAFPKQEPDQPPKGLYAFCRHYTKGFEVPLISMSLLSAVIAMIEVSLFGFMGQLVDWLSTHDRETFLAQEGQTLLLLGFLIVVIVPILLFIHSLLTHQTLLGNYPMAIRWQAHRYLLKQSVSFYSDDFAGRIATKVMQTALAVRETVMKLLDVLVYVSVYFTSMVVMVGQADWRLMLPMLIWFAAYVAIQFHFVPKLKAISEQQADARSTMTGRVVDSYTNINTVKLFSHSKRETQYAEEGMEEFLGTVHKQMRLATGINISVEIINYLLVFSIAAVSITLWLDNVLSVGAIAIAISLALRVNGMSHWIMWEISSLFENLGTVTDGINTLSKPIEITDKENASELNVSKGTIKFDSVNFNYGENKSVINDLNLEIKPGEKKSV